MQNVISVTCELCPGAPPQIPRVHPSATLQGCAEWRISKIIARSQKMSSRTLGRSGASLLNHFLTKPLLQQSHTSPVERVVSLGLDIAPRLFPSLWKLESSVILPPNQLDQQALFSGIPSPLRIPFSPLLLA